MKNKFNENSEVFSAGLQIGSNAKNLHQLYTLMHFKYFLFYLKYNLYSKIVCTCVNIISIFLNSL